jgi:nitrite reductase/ring-hydroxylating ferredoxin subunit
VIPLASKPCEVPPDGFVDALAFAELPPGAQKTILYGFERILLCHTDEGVRAVVDVCPHALQPLAGSAIVGAVIRCAKHGAEFDLATGKPCNGVTRQSLRVYPVRIRDGRIQVRVNKLPA